MEARPTQIGVLVRCTPWLVAVRPDLLKGRRAGIAKAHTPCRPEKEGGRTRRPGISILLMEARARTPAGNSACANRSVPRQRKHRIEQPNTEQGDGCGAPLAAFALNSI